MSTAVEQFWGETVLAGPFATIQESWASLAARAELYPDLYELMPVEHAGLDVLDFGCGPGHDTVLMLENGAHTVYFADVSPKAMDITHKRLLLHDLSGWVGLRAHDAQRELWLPAVDHIHCAGVLHHTSHPEVILTAFRNALRDGFECRIMVYDGDRSTHSQSDVPVTNWWGDDDMHRLAEAAGFAATYVGGYDCSAPWRPDCMAACWSLR